MMVISVPLFAGLLIAVVFVLRCETVSAQKPKDWYAQQVRYQLKRFEGQIYRDIHAAFQKEY